MPDAANAQASIALAAALVAAVGSARAADDVYVRFVDPKPTYHQLADARLALVDCADCEIKFAVGGRGVIAVELTDGLGTRQVAVDPKLGQQTLTERVRIAPGLNLVRVRTVDQRGQRRSFAMRLARAPVPGDPPLIALTAPPEPGDNAFARGVVLGDAPGRVFVAQDRLDDRTYLDDVLEDGSRLHEFVTCIALHAGRNRLWFGLQTEQAPERTVYAEVCNGECRDPVVKPTEKSQTAARPDAQ